MDNRDPRQARPGQGDSRPNTDNRAQDVQASVAGGQLARGTVARGRSVDVADTSKPPQVFGYMPDNKPIARHPQKSIPPGNEVELPVAEIATLRASGYLIDPDRVLPPLDIGPRYTEHSKAA